MKHLSVVLCGLAASDAFVLLSAVPACGQRKSPEGPLPPALPFDTNYIASHRNLLCVNLVNTLRDLDMTVTNPGNTAEQLVYRTNNFQNWGLGASYKWLSVELSTRVPFLSPRDKRKGTTRPFGLRFGVNGRKFWFNSFFQYYEGMYLNNPQGFDSQWFATNRNYPLRPDIGNLTIYATGNYAFNHRRFSQNASLWQVEQQKRSAGTFIVGLSAGLYGIQADSSVVPQRLQGRFAPSANVISSGTFYFGINAGYLHTFVIKQRGFIHLGLIPSIGIQGRGYLLSDSTQVSQGEGAATAEFRFSMGYNGRLYYGGLAAASIAFADNASFGGVIGLTHSYVRLFFGRRFRLGFRVPIVDRRK